MNMMFGGTRVLLEVASGDVASITGAASAGRASVRLAHASKVRRRRTRGADK